MGVGGQKKNEGGQSESSFLEAVGVERNML